MSLLGADGAGPGVEGGHPELPTPRGAPESGHATTEVITLVPPVAPHPAPTPSGTAGSGTAEAPPTAVRVPPEPATPPTRHPPAPGGRSRWSADRRRTLVLAGGQVIGLLLTAVAFSTDPTGTARAALLVDGAALTLIATAVLFALAAGRARPRPAAVLGWSCLAAATIGAAVGPVVDALSGQGTGQPSTPSLVSTLCWAVLSCAAIWMLAGERATQWKHRRVDGLSVAFGVMGPGLALLTAVTDPGESPLASWAGSVALACIVVTTVTLVSAALMPSPGPRWLSGGAVLITVAALIAAADQGAFALGVATLLRLGGLAVASLAALPVGIAMTRSIGRDRRAGSALSSGIVLQVLAIAGSLSVVLLAVLGVQVGRTAAVLALAAVVVGLPRAGLLIRETAGPLLPLSRPTRSRTDDLTGLANRRAVSEALAADLTRSPEAGGWQAWPDRISLLLVDLDRFKDVNDALGHELGDRLLTEVGARIGTALRPSQLLARLGGDEFVVVLPGVALEQAEQIARALRGSLERPFVLDGNRLHVRASVGIASCRLHDDQPADLLRQADVAMDDAKKSAAGIAVYDPRQDQNSANRLRRIDELRRALERGDLEVHLQPQVDLRTGSVIGVEALARWRHPQDGVLLPDSFLPLAAQTGLMGPVAALVLDRALAACATWWLRGYYLPVGVNLTADDLRDPALPGLVTKSLRRHLLPPSALRVEITEEALLHDAPATAALLARWRADGLSIAIDDYGTGYSSLAYLRQLPVDEIKLDRAFAHDLRRPTTAIIVRHTVAMAHGLELRVVAEGVEDEATARTLTELGCDIGQGLYFGAAMTTDDFLDLIRAHR